MAGKKKGKGPEIIGKDKNGREIINRFDENWDDVPNFKLTDAKPKKKPAAKKPKK